MKRLIACSAAWLFIGAGDVRAQGPTATACMPAVSVVVPAARKSARPSRQSEVVQVYWDVSKSMHDFAVSRTVRRANKVEHWNDDLSPIVAALDSRVLLLAHANSVEQYGVGADIEPLASARDALHPTASRTALHLAAERIGTALATGSAEAALIVSDLELDTPPRTPSARTVCGGIPLPSTPLAGSLFGRCFERALLGAADVPLTRTNLLVHVFRKRTHDRELFILLLATDRPFGLRISDEIVRRLDFSRDVIFDSSAVAAANVRGCTLTMPVPDARPRVTSGCGAKCFDPDAAIQSVCEVRRPSGAWIDPSATTDRAVSFEPAKRKSGDAEERAVVRFTIPCNAPPGRFNATVSFTWRRQTPWMEDSGSTFTRNESVRDLFESLCDAIVNTAAPRSLRIGVDLFK